MDRDADVGTAGPWITALFATTTFVGAGLLFVVQPLVARLLLPSYGGSATVWSTASLFFEFAAGGVRVGPPVDRGPRPSLAAACPTGAPADADRGIPHRLARRQRTGGRRRPCAVAASHPRPDDRAAFRRRGVHGSGERDLVLVGGTTSRGSRLPVRGQQSGQLSGLAGLPVSRRTQHDRGHAEACVVVGLPRVRRPDVRVRRPGHAGAHADGSRSSLRDATA